MFEGWRGVRGGGWMGDEVDGVDEVDAFGCLSTGALLLLIE